LEKTNYVLTIMNELCWNHFCWLRLWCEKFKLLSHLSFKFAKGFSFFSDC